MTLGLHEGVTVGRKLGRCVGEELGFTEGVVLGTKEGVIVGLKLGTIVGNELGKNGLLFQGKTEYNPNQVQSVIKTYKKNKTCLRPLIPYYFLNLD